MIGSDARFEQVSFDGPNDPRITEYNLNRMGHGIPSLDNHWLPMSNHPDKPSEGSQVQLDKSFLSLRGLPTKQHFGGANGGEVRKSFHGLAPGFVQVIDSPTQFQITPMQIDTWNRDLMNNTYPNTFVPGPLPANSLSPTSGPDAIYSGLYIESNEPIQTIF